MTLLVKPGSPQAQKLQKVLILRLEKCMHEYLMFVTLRQHLDMVYENTDFVNFSLFNINFPNVHVEILKSEQTLKIISNLYFHSTNTS